MNEAKLGDVDLSGSTVDGLKLSAGCTLMPLPAATLMPPLARKRCTVIPPPVSHESRQPVAGGPLELAQNATLRDCHLNSDWSYQESACSPFA